MATNSDSEAIHPALKPKYSKRLSVSNVATVVLVCVCQYPVCVQDMQSVHERHYSLLQRVQRVLLRVLLSEVAPQAPQRISEQLHLLRLQTRHPSGKLESESLGNYSLDFVAYQTQHLQF